MSEITLLDKYRLEPMTLEHSEDLSPIFTDVRNLVHIASKNINAHDLCQKSEEHWGKYGFGMLAIIEQQTGNIVGRGGFRLWQGTELHEGNLEYQVFIDHAHANKGLGTALAQHSLKYAFALPNTHIVQAVATPENIPSLKMLENAGMKIMPYPITQTVDGEPVKYALACQSIAMHRHKDKTTSSPQRSFSR